VARLKILIIGHGRHGKDTVGDFLAEIFGLPVKSSSEFVAERAVFPLVSDLYPDWRACYEDRASHRELWFHAIRAYNLRPGPMLAQQMLVDFDVYTGMRSRAEFERARACFDHVLWVDRSSHLPPETGGSMELIAADASEVIDNNGSILDLRDSVCEFMARAVIN
jgi:hypothetical protein